MENNTAASTLAELKAAGAPKTEQVQLDEDGESVLVVTARELSGAERFEFADLADVGTWETYRWLAHRGLTDPQIEDEAELDEIRPEWVMMIAEVVMRLSGIADNSEDNAEKKSEENTDTGSG